MCIRDRGGTERLEELIAPIVAPCGIAEYPGKRHIAVVAFEQIDGSIEDGLAFADGPGAGVHAGVGEKVGDGVEAKTPLRHANPEIIVERAVDLGIERTAAVRRSAHEGRRLADETVTLQY